MIDFVQLVVRAGDGGNGRISFRREKYVPKGGPDGGRGGNGGNVVVRASKHVATLKHLAGIKEIAARSGEPGGARSKTGSKGDSVVVDVPVGTVVWLVAENRIARKRRFRKSLDVLLSRDDLTFEQFHFAKEGESIPWRDPDLVVSLDHDYQAVQENSSKTAGIESEDEDGEEKPNEFSDADKVELVSLSQDGQEIVLCQGGFGGRGNETFKSSENTTPLQAEYGTFGEQRLVQFELKLLADVGLVGFPNVGKSTITSRLTGARTKVANYPFTTIEPHLGVLKLQEPGGKAVQELVVADIPGLIEGASEGKGLGHDFLRHVENTRALWFVLALDEVQLYDDQSTIEEKAAQVFEQFKQLRLELEQHNPRLMHKPALVSLNKVDLYTPELTNAIRSVFKKKGYELMTFSAATGEGLDDVKREVFQIAQE